MKKIILFYEIPIKTGPFSDFPFPVYLGTYIDLHNEVRLIDMFVDGLDLKPLGFDVDFVDRGARLSS